MMKHGHTSSAIFDSLRRMAAGLAAACVLALLQPGLASAQSQAANQPGGGPTVQLPAQVAQLVDPNAQTTQPQGRIRIQGRDTFDNTTPDTGPTIPLLDFREEMRTFIDDIGKYAHQTEPNFSIFVEDSLDLLVKRDDVDQTQTSPARTYMRSIDGVLATNLFSGGEGLDDNQNKLKRAARLKLLDLAKKNGLQVFVLDHETKPSAINKARSEARKRGYVYAARSSNTFETTDLPAYPKRPFDEDGNSVVSNRDIKNFVEVGNSARYGRQDEFALDMHRTNYDALIVDVFHGRQPLSKQAVETLKYKATGARRLVFARIDIGKAASYRYYWQPNWHQGSPPWIGAPLRGDPDQYFVEYWNPEWQRIISGDTKSYVYGVLNQGYDGVILAGADTYEVFESDDIAQSRTQQQ